MLRRGKKGQVPIQPKNSNTHTHTRARAHAHARTLLLPLGILVPVKETTDDQLTIRQGTNHPEEWQLGGINLEPLPPTMYFPHLQLQSVRLQQYLGLRHQKRTCCGLHKVQAPRIMRELIQYLYRPTWHFNLVLSHMSKKTNIVFIFAYMSH